MTLPQNDRPIDVVGIGNALVDVLAFEPDALIAELGMIKGAMNLIDGERSAMIRSRLDRPLEMAGGSAANTMAGVASLGGDAHYLGKVADDRLGRVFADSIRELGLRYTTLPATNGTATGCCAIVVTPDAQRTMNTHLGASVDFSPADVDRDVIAAGKILYLEGYLFDPPHAQEAFRVAATYAREAGTLVALTLSDPFCVERHRAAFQDLVDGHVDLVFGNADEIRSLFEVDDLDGAITIARERCGAGAITRGANGSTLFRDHEIVDVPAHEPTEIVDTTGAGDLYAAGVLFGLARGYDLETCGHLGSAAASEVLSHLGARPQTPLADLVRDILPSS
jgi:sugar/nucleoside kinase (ribokinase family)